MGADEGGSKEGGRWSQHGQEWGGQGWHETSSPLTTGNIFSARWRAWLWLNRGSVRSTRPHTLSILCAPDPLNISCSTLQRPWRPFDTPWHPVISPDILWRPLTSPDIPWHPVFPRCEPTPPSRLTTRGPSLRCWTGSRRSVSRGGRWLNRQGAFSVLNLLILYLIKNKRILIPLNL